MENRTDRRHLSDFIVAGIATVLLMWVYALFNNI